MERGYAATTIDDIADRRGATKGHVYHYFRSKADIFLAVLDEAMKLVDVARPIVEGEGTPAERLHELARTHAMAMMTDVAFHRVMVQGTEHHTREALVDRQRKRLEDIIRDRDAYEKFFTDLIEEGQAVGEFRQLDARLATKPLLGALNWITVWYRPELTMKDGERERIADEVANYVVSGLRAF